MNDVVFRRFKVQNERNFALFCPSRVTIERALNMQMSGEKNVRGVSSSPSPSPPVSFVLLQALIYDRQRVVN